MRHEPAGPRECAPTRSAMADSDRYSLKNPSPMLRQMIARMISRAGALSDGERRQRRDHQQYEQRVAQLTYQHRQRAGTVTAQRVRPDPDEPCRGLGTRQTAGRTAEPGQHILMGRRRGFRRRRRPGPRRHTSRPFPIRERRRRRHGQETPLRSFATPRRRRVPAGRREPRACHVRRRATLVSWHGGGDRGSRRG